MIRRPTRGGTAAARNTGILDTESELIAFLDDDCICSSGWIDAVFAGFADGHNVLAGLVLPLDGGSNIFSAIRHRVWYAENFGGPYADGALDPMLGSIGPGGPVGYASGGNSAYRREVFGRRGLFREGLPTYCDVELGNRLCGEDTPFLRPDMTVFHEHPTSISSFGRRSFASGRAKGILAQVLADTRWSAKVVLREVAKNIFSRNLRRARRLKEHGVLQAWLVLTVAELVHAVGYAAARALERGR